MFILPNQDIVLDFQFYNSCISFMSGMWFSSYNLSGWFGSLIPRYVIDFGGHLNGSSCSRIPAWFVGMLIFRISDLEKFILKFETSLNQWNSLRFFWVGYNQQKVVCECHCFVLLSSHFYSSYVFVLSFRGYQGLHSENKKNRRKGPSLPRDIGYLQGGGIKSHLLLFLHKGSYRAPLSSQLILVQTECL